MASLPSGLREAARPMLRSRATHLGPISSASDSGAGLAWRKKPAVGRVTFSWRERTAGMLLTPDHVRSRSGRQWHAGKYCQRTVTVVPAL